MMSNSKACPGSDLRDRGLTRPGVCKCAEVGWLYCVRSGKESGKGSTEMDYYFLCAFNHTVRCPLLTTVGISYERSLVHESEPPVKAWMVILTNEATQVPIGITYIPISPFASQPSLALATSHLSDQRSALVPLSHQCMIP